MCFRKSASRNEANFFSCIRCYTNAKLNEQGITPNIGVPAKGDASSTTKSAIAPGTIEVRSNPNQDISGLSRDTNNALNALGKIFDKKTVQEQQELAQVFGEVAYEQVHIMSSNAQKAAQDELDAAKKKGASQEVLDGLQAKVDAWSEGGVNKIALHALVGGIMSDFGGSSFGSGAVGAGVNEALQKELSNITDPALHQWASAVVGAAAAKVVGGDAQAGASTAASGTKNNLLSTQLKSKLIKIGDKEFNVTIITGGEIAYIKLEDNIDEVDSNEIAKQLYQFIYNYADISNNGAKDIVIDIPVNDSHDILRYSVDPSNGKPVDIDDEERFCRQLVDKLKAATEWEKKFDQLKLDFGNLAHDFYKQEIAPIGQEIGTSILQNITFNILQPDMSGENANPWMYSLAKMFTNAGFVIGGVATAIGGAGAAIVTSPNGVFAAAAANAANNLSQDANKILASGGANTGTIAQGSSNTASIEDILKGATESTNGKGIARNFDKSGGFEQTLKDFESLDLTLITVKNIQIQYGPGKVGKLRDGTTVVARPGSKTGGPTLEITVSNSKVYKVRY